MGLGFSFFFRGFRGLGVQGDFSGFRVWVGWLRVTSFRVAF